MLLFEFFLLLLPLLLLFLSSASSSSSCSPSAPASSSSSSFFFLLLLLFLSCEIEHWRILIFEFRNFELAFLNREMWELSGVDDFVIGFWGICDCSKLVS